LVLKPNPDDLLDLPRPLKALGVDPLVHDLRFVETTGIAARRLGLGWKFASAWDHQFTVSAGGLVSSGDGRITSTGAYARRTSATCSTWSGPSGREARKPPRRLPGDRTEHPTGMPMSANCSIADACGPGAC
jgi:hypothetical protein